MPGTRISKSWIKADGAYSGGDCANRCCAVGACDCARGGDGRALSLGCGRHSLRNGCSGRGHIQGSRVRRARVCVEAC